MRKTRILASGAAASLALTLAACGVVGGDSESEGSGGDTLAQLKDDGKITVGFAGEEPYSFEKDGELDGATIALHEEIFGELGIEEVEGVKTEWNSLIPGLNAGDFDVISAGMSILPVRATSIGDPSNAPSIQPNGRSSTVALGSSKPSIRGRIRAAAGPCSARSA